MVENRNTKFGKSLGLSLAVAVALGAMSAKAAQKDHVLVIDEGVDLQHFELKNRAFLNTDEFYGNKNYDDDQNGLVDDVSGWNLLSNDNAFFPDHVRKTFTDNEEVVTKLLGLYDRIESGDREAIEYVYGNPDLASAMGWVLSKSHGTHVAGIIVKYGNQNAVVASANVFTSSVAETAPDNSTAPTTLAQPALTSGFENYSKGLEALANRMATVTADDASSANQGSVFDDTAGITQYVKESAASDKVEKALMSKYLKTTGARVVNLSLGFAKITWKLRLDGFWADYLKKNNLPATKRMNTTQRANYSKLLSVFDNSKKNWNSLFRANKSTLFVIAAGNDGDMDVPSAGNNYVNKVIPANCSQSNPNVITVAATTPEGVIADFSNYNGTLVNIGAWGVAVPSLAPNNGKVKMSGTSMASPYVAGVASAMFSANARLTAHQAKTILMKTAKAKASLQGKVSSNGMVDPTAAVRAARNLSSGVTLNDAVISGLKSGDTLRLPGFGFRPGFTRTLDTTLVGQVHKTGKLVKRFLR